MPSANFIVSITVTYNPNLELLQRQLDSLLLQVDHVIIVDNRSQADSRTWLSTKSSERITVLMLDENEGIANAQNAGIRVAQRLNATHVLLMDHDSVPATDMVAALSKACMLAARRGRRVASVGPRYIDERQANPPPFIRIEKGRLKRLSCDCANDVVEVDYLIASGCLISIEALNVVGLMLEDLFIDYVDIEWGMRARAMGFHNYGACGARMAHALGDAPIRRFGKSFPVRSPLRHYYMFRNAVWLYRQSWVRKDWKRVDGYRLLLKFGFYLLFAKPRLAHMKMMCLGLFHGATGKLGRYEE